MTIRIQCTSCGASLKIQDDFGGKRGKCPMCGESIEIPKPIPPATEKQKEFALSLGIEFPDDVDRKEISILIDKALDRQKEEKRQEINDLEIRNSEAWIKFRREIIDELTIEDMIAELNFRDLEAIVITFDLDTDVSELIDCGIKSGDNLNHDELGLVISKVALAWMKKHCPD